MTENATGPEVRETCCTLVVSYVSASKKMDDMARAADVFEVFKHLGTFQQIEITSNKPLDITKTVDVIRRGLEDQGEFVSAVWVGKEHVGAYRNPSVRVVSDGTRWCMLDELLKHYGGPEAPAEIPHEN